MKKSDKISKDIKNKKEFISEFDIDNNERNYVSFKKLLIFGFQGSGKTSLVSKLSNDNFFGQSITEKCK